MGSAIQGYKIYRVDNLKITNSTTATSITNSVIDRNQDVVFLAKYLLGVSSSLIKIQESTGNITDTKSISHYFIQNLGIDPTNKKLWVMTYDTSIPAQGFLVYDYNLNLLHNQTFPNTNNYLQNVAFDTTNDKMYALYQYQPDNTFASWFLLGYDPNDYSVLTNKTIPVDIFNDLPNQVVVDNTNNKIYTSFEHSMQRYDGGTDNIDFNYNFTDPLLNAPDCDHEAYFDFAIGKIAINCSYIITTYTTNMVPVSDLVISGGHLGSSKKIAGMIDGHTLLLPMNNYNGFFNFWGWKKINMNTNTLDSWNIISRTQFPRDNNYGTDFTDDTINHIFWTQYESPNGCYYTPAGCPQGDGILDNRTSYFVALNSTNGDFAYKKLVGTAGAGATSYTDSSNIQPNTLYTYFVVPYNSIGDGIPSLAAIVTTSTGGTQASIKFDNSTYAIDSAGTITVNDPSVTTNTVTANVNSTSDPTGIQITLQENGTNSQQFVSQNYIRFTNASSSNAAFSLLKVNVGDIVKATYGSISADAKITAPSIYGIPITINQLSLPAIACTSTTHDGICDSWKTPNGLAIPMMGITYNYPCRPLLDDRQNSTFNDTTHSNITTCPSPTKKDIYIELDYMQLHKPDDQALWQVIQAFQTHQINLHIQVDDEIPFDPVLDAAIPWNPTPSGHDFLDLKNQFFGTQADRTNCPSLIPGSTACQTYISNILNAKRQVFHYAMFTHDQAPPNTGFSGISEVPGNDFEISLGSFVGSFGQESGTFMHELGHNLGLGHGGPISIQGIPTNDNSLNCKPNYFSIMNYLFQFEKSDLGFVQGRPLDYSESKVDSINETKINDQVGIGQTSPPGLYTVIGGVDSSQKYQNITLTQAGTAPVDYDRDNLTPNISYEKNIHLFNVVGCDLQSNNHITTLNGYSDWDNLNFNFRTSGFFLNGLAPDQQVENEITNKTIAAIQVITQAPTPVPDPVTAASIVNAGSNTTINEGSTFTSSGSIVDYFSTSFSATVDYADGSGVQPLSISDKSFTLSHIYGEKGIYNVLVTISNNRGGVTIASLTVTVNDVPLQIGSLIAPVNPVQVGTAIIANATFTDPGTQDIDTAIWDWGDGTTSPGTITKSGGSGSISNSHTYTSTGVYTVQLNVTNNDGSLATTNFQYVVIYDPNGGFVTASGSVNSTAGAYLANTTLTGKGHFGFNVKYKNGSTIPTGSLNFNLKDSKTMKSDDDDEKDPFKFKLKATGFNWLVINGANAQFTGTGTINGTGNYGFTVTMYDGEISGTGKDQFGIKIVDNNNGGAVVYDTSMGTAHTAIVPLTKGNAKIHQS